MNKCGESILCYGITASGKTTQFAELMRYVRERYGNHLIGRLVSVEGWSVIQPEVDAKIIDPLYLRSAHYPFQWSERITMGWWPNENGKLIPPDQQPDFKNVGAYCFDGITGMCQWLMGCGLEEEAKGAVKGVNERTGEEKWILTRRFSSEGPGVIFKEGDAGDESVFAMPSRASYGSTQKLITNLIANSKAIPVPYVYWTALEDRGKDDKKNAVYGPDAAGEALAGIIPSWFDRTVRLSVINKSGGQTVRAMYLTNHFIGNDPIPYIANVRSHYKRTIPPTLTGGDVSLYKLLHLLEGEK